MGFLVSGCVFWKLRTGGGEGVASLPPMLRGWGQSLGEAGTTPFSRVCRRATGSDRGSSCFAEDPWWGVCSDPSPEFPTEQTRTEIIPGVGVGGVEQRRGEVQVQMCVQRQVQEPFCSLGSCLDSDTILPCVIMVRSQACSVPPKLQV